MPLMTARSPPPPRRTVRQMTKARRIAPPPPSSRNPPFLESLGQADEGATAVVGFLVLRRQDRVALSAGRRSRSRRRQFVEQIGDAARNLPASGPTVALGLIGQRYAVEAGELGLGFQDAHATFNGLEQRLTVADPIRTIVLVADPVKAPERGPGTPADASVEVVDQFRIAYVAAEISAEVTRRGVSTISSQLTWKRRATPSGPAGSSNRLPASEPSR